MCPILPPTVARLDGGIAKQARQYAKSDAPAASFQAERRRPAGCTQSQQKAARPVAMVPGTFMVNTRAMGMAADGKARQVRFSSATWSGRITMGSRVMQL